MPGSEQDLYADYLNDPSAELQRRAMSEAYALGYRLRKDEWPLKQVSLAMAVVEARDLLAKVEVLYEHLTGESPRGYAWRDVLDRSRFEREARNEIEQLTEGGE